CGCSAISELRSSCLTSWWVLNMTYFISLASIRGLSRDLRRCGSVNIALAFVASIEYLSPSSPSVSYEVTIGIDCEAAPCMAASLCALFESGRQSRSDSHL